MLLYLRVIPTAREGTARVNRTAVTPAGRSSYCSAERAVWGHSTGTGKHHEAAPYFSQLNLSAQPRVFVKRFWQIKLFGCFQM